MKVLIYLLAFIAISSLCFSVEIPDYDNPDYIMEMESPSLGITVQINNIAGAGEIYHGGHDNYESTTSDVKSASSPSLEVLFGSGGLHIGLGAEMQSMREFDINAPSDYDKPAFGFNSVFLVGRFDIPIGTSLSLELIGRAGYNEIDTDGEYLKDIENSYSTIEYDTVGGSMFGGGVGLVLSKHIIIQGIYTEHHAETTVDRDLYYPPYFHDSYDMDIKYSQIGLGVGFRL